jgi:hypothetical protein
MWNCYVNYKYAPVIEVYNFKVYCLITVFSSAVTILSWGHL